MKPRALAVAAGLSLASLACAQNEIVFIGTSVGGSVDPHFFVSSATGTVVSSGGNTFTNNVTDAVWMDFGQNLYCAKSLGNDVTRAQWNGTSATWSTFYAATGPCYGLGADRARRRLWTLTGTTASSSELVCLDADPASLTYGQVVTQTTTLSGVLRERWALSPSGNLAAVPHAFTQGGLFEVIDTNPASPTFLQVIASAPITGASAGFSIAVACAISGDDQYAYVVYSGLGFQGMAVMFVPTTTWLDFDAVTPGQQDFAIALPVPNSMALSPYNYSAVVAGQGGTGWAVRIDVDPANPGNTTLTQYLGGSGVLGSCDGTSLSAEGGRVAVTALPAKVVLIDAQTGALLHNVSLPGASNIYTTAWQDLRPDAAYTLYGAGCPGSLGVPALVASGAPKIGAPFQVTVNNLPMSVALFVIGFSDTMSGPFPLPLNLGQFNMPGCQLLAEAFFTTLLVGAGNSASWSIFVPNNPGLLGFVVFNQAFSLDPGINLAGFTVSRGGRLLVGI